MNEKNFVGLATDGDYITCGSENNGLYVYYKVNNNDSENDNDTDTDTINKINNKSNFIPLNRDIVMSLCYVKGCLTDWFVG